MSPAAAGAEACRNLGFLRWPWSLALPVAEPTPLSLRATIPFEGLALTACSPDVRLLPLGGGADLALLAQPLGLNVYELPQGRVGAVCHDLELQAASSTVRETWRVDLVGARTRLDASPHGEENESAEAVAVRDWWTAFDDIRDLREGPTGGIAWHAVEEWLGQQRSASDPRKALIVEIAERLGLGIADRVRHLRRILLRRRDRVPVHRIVQLDEECLRWYMRQPGTTLAEKAGNKQEIVSVVRQESFDTLENRVLKDFLRRCSIAAARYVRQFRREFPNSERVLLVARYGRECEAALGHPEFEGIAKPRPGVNPNYVLQNDARYREIWRWYQKLLRNQDSEEQVWNWQSRLFSDVCRLLLATGCRLALSPSKYDASTEWPVPRASFGVDDQGRLGRRLTDSWAPGPLVLRGQDAAPRAVVSIVDSDQAHLHPIVAPLVSAGGHAYVVREPLGGTDQRAQVLVVWAINAIASASSSAPSIVLGSATAAIQNLTHQGSRRNEAASPGLHGLVLRSRHGTVSYSHGTDLDSLSAKTQIGLVEVPADPRGWDEAAVDIAAWVERWLQ